MKGLSYRFASVALISLSAACASVGRDTAGNTVQNQSQPTEPPVSQLSDAKPETAALPPRVGTSYKGSVGNSKIEMDSKREGGACTGSYYVVKQGSSNRLTLKGTIAADGSFTM